VKVGYNLRRKVVLHAIWLAAPLVLSLQPTLFGLLPPPSGPWAFLDNLALAWLVIGVGAVVFRTLQLFVLQGVQSGLVWFTKILTDPFHDIRIYYKAPYHLWRGDMYDDMSDWYDRSVSAGRA
jgi:hypothetical protein